MGPNQCKNDKDGTVDPDERLRITGIAPGSYDAKLKDVSGRTCLVRNVKVEAGEIFSIEEKELTSCRADDTVGAFPRRRQRCRRLAAAPQADSARTRFMIVGSAMQRRILTADRTQDYASFHWGLHSRLCGSPATNK